MKASNEMTIDEFAAAFMRIRNEMTTSAGKNMSEALKQIVPPADVVQETYYRAAANLAEFPSGKPIRERFLSMMLDDILALEKKHHTDQIAASSEQKVDIDMSGMKDESRIRMVRSDPYAAIHKIIDELSEQDRQILDLRLFKGMNNIACAKALKITPREAETRYARAFRVVTSAMRAQSVLRTAARQAATCGTKAGSFRFPRIGTGAR